MISPGYLHTKFIILQSLYMWTILYLTIKIYWLLSYARIYSCNIPPPTLYSRYIRNLVIGTSSISRYAPFPLNYTSRLMTLKMFQFNSFDPENFLMLFINFYRIVSYLQRIKLEQFCFVIFNYKYSSILRKVWVLW